MIVKCENCQTRFKIPDDKVTEKGVKVRCTKCSHTFRVKRDAEGNALIVPAAPSAGPPVKAVPAPENPFASFAPVTPPGGDMFSKETRVAPRPVRPPGSPERVGVTPPPPAPEAQADVTVRAAGPSDPEVTRKGPPPSRDQLAVAFGLEPEALTNPAGAYGAFVPGPGPGSGPHDSTSSAMTHPGLAFGELDAQGSSSSSATTDPAATYGAPGPKVSALSSAPVGSDPFGEEAQLGPPPGRGPDHSLFDIPPPPPEAPASALDQAPGGLGDPGSFAPGLQGAPAPLQTPMMAPHKPAGRPEDARGFEEQGGAGAARRITGLLVNLAVAAGLVLLLLTGGSVYLNEGKLDLSAFSAERMASL
ncbi:MAG TPA: zinc-ribbon domain-containing protein, partial [Myxococcaceae bacterium]